MSIRLKKFIKVILIYLASISLAIITAEAPGSIPLNVSNWLIGKKAGFKIKPNSSSNLNPILMLA